MKNSFSIIIPIHGSRKGTRPLLSLIGQYGNPDNDFEVLVVEDDNSHLDENYKHFPMVKIVSHHDQRLERAISTNEGLAAAAKDWIIFLDSDDELLSTALYDLDYCINKYPEYKIFHYGGIVMWEPKTSDEVDYNPQTTIRSTPDLPDGDPGMGYFETGLVGNGHFCFKRELYQELGGFPNECSPYELAKRGVEEFPELGEMMKRRNVDTLGNPWGQDFLYMYKLTRKYKSKALPLLLYLQHIRR